MNPGHSERAHSEIGASGAARWIACPGSVALSRGEPNTSSIYADEGTAAHELAQMCLDGQKPASAFLGHIITVGENVFEVDEIMADAVQTYLDNIAPWIGNPDCDTFVEESFQLAHLHPNLWGTNDFAAAESWGTLLIADLKYGRTVVRAKNNFQLIIYALGAYHLLNHIYDFQRVKLQIHQPRVPGNEVDEWEISVQELLEHEKIISRAIAQVYGESPAIVPGDHCKYCPAKVKCPAIKSATEELITRSFDEPMESGTQLPYASEMTSEQLGQVMKYAPMIRDWLDGVETYAKSCMERGHEVPGFKLVTRQTKRKVKDPEALIEEFEIAYGDDLFDKKLKGLGALEKLIGKDELEPFLIKPVGENTVAPEHDKRPAVKTTTTRLLDQAAIDDEFETMDF